MGKRTFKTLSIVVPVYNEDRYLEAVISKLIAQPLPGNLERELIMVNDASQDATWTSCNHCRINFRQFGFN